MTRSTRSGGDGCLGLLFVLAVAVVFVIGVLHWATTNDPEQCQGIETVLC